MVLKQKITKVDIKLINFKNNMYGYLYILDYSKPGIYEIKLDENSSKHPRTTIFIKIIFI